MNENNEIDFARMMALKNIERKEWSFKLLVGFIALIEGVLLFWLVYSIDWSNPTHRVIFIATMLVYLVLGLGIFALAIYQNINTLKVLKALDVIHKD